MSREEHVCAGCNKPFEKGQLRDKSKQTGVYLHNWSDCLLNYAHEELRIEPYDMYRILED